MYVHMNIRVYVDWYLYVFKYGHVYICFCGRNEYVCLHESKYVRMFVLLPQCAYIYLHKYTYNYVHVRMFVLLSQCAYIYLHTYIYNYMHVRMYAYFYVRLYENSRT